LFQRSLHCAHGQIIAGQTHETEKKDLYNPQLKKSPIGYKSPCFFVSPHLKWTIYGEFNGL
jgi:hypothetical protein